MKLYFLPSQCALWEGIILDPDTFLFSFSVSPVLSQYILSSGWRVAISMWE